MKRKILHFFFISTLLIMQLLVGSVSSSEAGSDPPQLQWSKTFPRPPAKTTDNLTISHRDYGHRFVQTSDGGYTILGNLEDSFYRGQHSGSNFNYSGIILKTDSMGNLLWQNIDSTLKYSQFIFQTNDSGYLAVNQKWYIQKVDAQGSIQFNKTLEGPVGSTIRTNDGNYICLGQKYRESVNLMKIDEEGNVLWNEVLLNFYDDDLDYDVAAAKDGGYFMFVLKPTFGTKAGVRFDNFRLIKTNSTGHTQYIKYTSILDDVEKLGEQAPNSLNLEYILATKDGGYLISGRGWNRITFPFLVKLDYQGNWQWYRSYQNYFPSCWTTRPVPTADGGFLLAGAYGPSYNPKGYHADTPLLFKVDAHGNVLWNQSFSSTEDYHSGAIGCLLATSDGGFAVTGNLDNSIWLAKFAPEPGAEALPYSSTPPNNTSSDDPFLIVLTATTVIVIICVGLLVYLKKRKRPA